MKIDLTKLSTEQRNKNTMNLDELNSLEFVEVFNNEDRIINDVVDSIKHEIAMVIDVASETLKKGGRIIYIGAGTSGRLGVLDAVECPPTFGVDYDKVVGLMAGGSEAFVKAKEGAEDSLILAKEDLEAISFNKNDLLIGIAASGRTPYVIGALDYARSLNAKTASIICSKNGEISKHSDYPIEAVVGAEVLTGSTRLKAGSVQKLILNMISTGSMIQQGKVYQNLMVDVKLSNKKLVQRGINIICEVTGVDQEKAEEILERANRSVKTAIVMILHQCDMEEANQLLEKANGHIKKTYEV